MKLPMRPSAKQSFCEPTKKLLLFLIITFLVGCGSLNFSQISPEAKDFHPRTIAVLPATVGQYESARDIVDVAVSRNLADRGWFENVVDVTTIKTRTLETPKLAIDLSAYIQRINTLGVSDSEMAKRLHNKLKADALFLTYITSWGYGRMEGNKVGRVGLGLKLVDASKGTIIWKANHELTEDYLLFKPKLEEIADDLLEILINEMPH
ncbi:MAG TPA: hypothetical protein EYG28_09575 [Nitrospiria bacterium]|nr:hypothetical protein [Candidatus Manganitrophaceae bacterium]HIL35620.1 hypothetical protein [Candidatus Manganitrophaceae bacterium]